MSAKKMVLTALLVVCMTANAQAADTLTEAFMKGTLSGDIRMMSFSRDYETTTRRDGKQSSLGTNVYYNTAPLNGISAGVGVRANMDLGSPSTKGALDLIRTDDQNDRVDYVELQEYWLQGEWAKTSLKVGAQRLWTPWLRSHDLRMHPKAFRAAKLRSKYFDNLQLDLMHVTDIMGWTGESFQPVSQSGNLRGTTKDRGVTLTGLVWTPSKQLKIDAYEYMFWDMFNAIHGSLKYSHPLNETFTAYTDLRYMYQDSVGDELLGDFDTYQLGLAGGLKAYGADLTLQYAKIGDYNLQKPAGGNSLVLMQVYASGRAREEDVYGAKLSYDFGYLGVKGLSAYVYAGYFDSPDSGEHASYDIQEIDFNAQYKFSGILDGWKIRARYAICNGDDELKGDAADFHDARLYLTYKFNFTLEDLQ